MYMTNLLKSSLFCLLMVLTLNSNAQTKNAKQLASPPAMVTKKIGQTTIKINYSQPSIKGRQIGVNLEPMEGKVWRAGANEATIFEVDKDVVIEGQPLPKGKYGFFILVNGEAWTLIFNKTWKQWGAFKYNQADDALRVSVMDHEVESFSEKLTYTIGDDGTVSLLWGNRHISFLVQEKQ